MSHVRGQCPGWWDACYTARQCRICHGDRNANTWRKPGQSVPDRATATLPAVPGHRHADVKAGVGDLKTAGGVVPFVRPARSRPCRYLGDIVSECPARDPWRHVHRCNHLGKRACRGLSATAEVSCRDCAHYDPPGDDVPCGVAIGSYNLPKLIELQVRLVRDRCGPDVPILITDDNSDGYGHTPGPDTNCGRLRRLAASDPNVTLVINPVRLGQASGDLGKVYWAIQWAAVRKLKVVACLSQRLLIDQPRWLQRCATELVESGLSTMSAACIDEGPFPFRSEFVVIDAERWNRPAILDHLTPRKMTPIPGEWGIAAEFVYWHDIRDRLDGKLLAWPAMQPYRYRRSEGVLWHCNTPPADYAGVAKRYGLDLDAHFTCDGWRRHEGKDYRG